MTPAQLTAIAMLNAGEATLSEIAKLAGIDRSIARRWSMGIDLLEKRRKWLKNTWERRHRRLIPRPGTLSSQVFALADGTRTAKEISALIGVTRRDVTYALRHLRQRGHQCPTR